MESFGGASERHEVLSPNELVDPRRDCAEDSRYLDESENRKSKFLRILNDNNRELRRVCMLVCAEAWRCGSFYAPDTGASECGNTLLRVKALPKKQ